MLEDLKIFNLIYENRLFVMVPLYLLSGVYGVYLLFCLKKVFFLWLLIFPLFLAPLHIAFVASGYFYRMELREQFAKSPQGWYDIDRMPPAIRAEYAKHDYHPRLRDLKAMCAGTFLFTFLLYCSGGLAFSIQVQRRKMSSKE